MASPIDPALAKSLIKEFQQQNRASANAGIKTPDGSFMNGFFIDRASLDDILKDSNIVGISFHYAKHPDFAGKAGNYFTAIFAGAVPAPPGSATTYAVSGAVYDMIEPCPPLCSNM
jgi:hypothetical protein